MAEELVKYEDYVKKLLITNLHSSKSDFKIGVKKVKVTSSSIVINGKGRIRTVISKRSIKSMESTWDITIPLDSIVDVYHESFKAECAMHHHKNVVGIEAKIDDVLMSYAIFTNHAHDLFKIIQETKPPKED